MSAATPDSPDVPVEVLPPVPADAKITEAKPPLAGLKTFYHPASGVAILGIDLLCFGPEAIFPFDNTFLCPLAFVVTFPFVYFFQLKWSGDTAARAFGKAFLGAFLAGLPFSIVGTVYGAAILTLSGLPRNSWDALKRLTSRSEK